MPEVTQATTWVDPRIGTGGLGYAYGSCFVGAAAPHGFAKPGPDTNGLFGTVAFQHYSGYYAEDNRIQGFSSTHLHGTGATDYGVLSVMPTLAFDPTKTSVVDYETLFDKTDEHASAGYYDVTLANGIDAELTATQRVAVERYTMPSAGHDRDRSLEDAVERHGRRVRHQRRRCGRRDHRLAASPRRDVGAGFGGYTLYFVAHGTWTLVDDVGDRRGADRARRRDARSRSGCRWCRSRARARTSRPRCRPSTSTRSTTRRPRRGKPSSASVKLTAETEVQLRTFYTSLYHAFLMPSVIGDVDGTYQLAHQARGPGAGLGSDVGSLAVGHVSLGVAAVRVARAG